jgi:hypothetical protein
MKYSEFIEAYRNLLDKSRLVDADSEDERVLPIHETDWVQVILIQNPHDFDTPQLIVEVSFPAWIHDLSCTGAPIDSSLNYTKQLQTVLSQQVHHLEYILKLSHAGFHLAIIAEEGVWSAWTLLKDPPSRDLFLLLSPPEARL